MPVRLNPDGTIPTLQEEITWLKSIGHYWTFVFVRSPWERLLDAWLSRSPHATLWPPVAIDKFRRFTKVLDLDTLPLLSIPRYQQQWRFAEDVDFVGKFENLQADFDAVCAHLGVKPETLKHVHPSYLTYIDATFADFYDAETIEIVGQKYVKDIEQFGFAPPELP